MLCGAMNLSGIDTEWLRTLQVGVEVEKTVERIIDQGHEVEERLEKVQK